MPAMIPMIRVMIMSIGGILAGFVLIVTLGCAPRCTTSPVTVTFSDGSQTTWLMTTCSRRF